jgi:hypothetical protein
VTSKGNRVRIYSTILAGSAKGIPKAGKGVKRSVRGTIAFGRSEDVPESSGPFEETIGIVRP